MSEIEARETTEYLYAPESPAGASAQQYRSSAYPIHDFALLSATLTIALGEDPHRARFTFECLVAPAGHAASQEWSYDIPAAEAEISDAHAGDAAGNLQTDFQTHEGRATRLRVQFRRMVKEGQYRFWYAYEAPVRAVVSAGALTRMIVCTGWLIFNLPCDGIRVCIQLPHRSRLVKCVPVCEVSEPERGRPRAVYQLERLRSLETSQWMVAYERRKVGLPLYVWSASQAAAAFVGWLIGKVLDGWIATR